jgi:hypothetical protein
MRAIASLALLASALLACGPAPHTRGAGAVSALDVRAVAWNPGNAALGRVRAIADGGSVVAVFSDRGATVLSAGSTAATDASITDCASAAAIAGADGTAQWILGIRDNGRMVHLRGLRTFEDVTDRYGLGNARVLGATALGNGDVAFLLAGAIAIADGEHVMRYASADGVTFDELAGGAGFGAEVAKSEVRVLDLAHGSAAAYSLPEVTHAAIGANGRLYATTPRAVYAADGSGNLALVYDAVTPTIHGLVASGAHVWFADGDELGMVEGDRVAETSGAKIGHDAKLSASASGDVWVLTNGALDRFARAERITGTPSSAAAWSAVIAPIFARSCSACHLPDGISGTDLSNSAAWETERPHLRERVVEWRSMPPQGHPLSDADREVLRKWLEAPP